MAGSRLEKFGTIFKRVQGLLRSGALKHDDRPIWFDVYEAFPPKDPPIYERPVPDKQVPKIFYPEDLIRAKFYKVYGDPDVVDLRNEQVKTTCQKFVDKYLELLQTDTPKDGLFEAVATALKNEGIQLRSLDEMENSILQRPAVQSFSPPHRLDRKISIASIFGEETAKQASEDQDFVLEDDMDKDPKL